MAGDDKKLPLTSPPNAKMAPPAAQDEQSATETVQWWLDRWIELDRDQPELHDLMTPFIPHLTLLSAGTSPGTSVFRYVVQPAHCNRIRNLHGGAAATLFDFCTTMALAPLARPGFWRLLGVSRTLAVTYLRPVPEGAAVLVESEVVAVGRRLATVRGVLRREDDGVVCATCEHGKFNTDPEAVGKL